jgi:hypothetical protein
MAKLELPTEFHEGLASIINLSDEAFDKLVSALVSAPPALKPSILAANTASQIDIIPKEDITGIVEIVVSLHVVYSSADVTESEFLNDLCDALNETDAPELKLDDAGHEKFKQRLSRLLATKSLDVVSRGQSLQIDYDHRFCRGRVLTDIRPIFGSNPDESPMAAVVTNTLRITYHVDDDTKDFYVVINASDLRKLRESIERAEKKAEALKSVLDAAKVSYLE